MAYLGEFWFLRGSPYSLPAYWAIVYSRVQVKLRPCIPLISTFLLWLRLGMPRNQSGPLSLPLLFVRGSPRPVRGGAAIARAADAVRSRASSTVETPSLFPPRAVVQIDKCTRAADMICQHGRGLLLDAMINDPRVAERIVLPRILRNRFFTAWLLRFFERRMRAKYPGCVSRDQIRKVLMDLRKMLTKGDGSYLCSDSFTFGDICVASSLYFAVSRQPGSPKDIVYSDRILSDEFQDLVQWRRSIFERHYPGSEADAYNFAPPVHRQG